MNFGRCIHKWSSPVFFSTLDPIFMWPMNQLMWVCDTISSIHHIMCSQVKTYQTWKKSPLELITNLKFGRIFVKMQHYHCVFKHSISRMSAVLLSLEELRLGVYRFCICEVSPSLGNPLHTLHWWHKQSSLYGCTTHSTHLSANVFFNNFWEIKRKYVKV